MDSVTSNLLTSERINSFLDYLLRAWEEIPSVAAEWDDLHPLEQMSFEADWSICRDRLHQVEHAAQAGRLTQEQRKRLERLRRIVEVNSPILDKMFATPIKWQPE